MTPDEQAKLHAIEVDWRAGLMSKRAVARKHGLALSTLLDTARRNEWQRDPALAAAALAEGQAHAIEAHTGEVIPPASRPGRPPAPALEQLPAEVVVDAQAAAIKTVLVDHAAAGREGTEAARELIGLVKQLAASLTSDLVKASGSGTLHARQQVLASAVRTSELLARGLEALEMSTGIERKAAGLPDKVADVRAVAGAQASVQINVGGPTNPNGIAIADFVASDGHHLCEACANRYLTEAEREESDRLTEQLSAEDIVFLIERTQNLDDESMTARATLQWKRDRVRANQHRA